MWLGYKVWKGVIKKTLMSHQSLWLSYKKYDIGYNNSDISYKKYIYYNLVMSWLRVGYDLVMSKVI